jgi:hypothetical protein
MAMGMQTGQAWWRNYSLPEGQVRRWRIGPLTLWAQWMPGEWRVAWRSSGDPLDAALELDGVEQVDDFLTLDNATRFAREGAEQDLWLRPALADRPVVTQSEKPVQLMPHQQMYVYVSSPLWVQLQVGQQRELLIEVPVIRPSDTWFGPNTLIGELCYSSRTVHRLHLDKVPIRPHRATTAVLVKNRADSLFSLERMRIPVPLLTLCQTEEGRLWTQEVIYQRQADDQFAEMRLAERIGKTCVHDQTFGDLLAEPRQAIEDNLVVRAFSSLFNIRES